MKAILAMILAAALLLAFGCAGQAQASLNGTVDGQGQVVPGTSGGNGTEVIGDNRTGYDKTNETIALAVADGTYSDQIRYVIHPGQSTEKNETVEVNVTVENDTVMAVSVEGMDLHPWSQKIVTDFNAALPDLVVGKKITEIDLPTNVAGSSLTNAAFKAHIGDLIEKY